ncbi:MAG: FAD-dependent oxidoreductase, partial [Planctomycetota bacterium]
MPPEPDADLAVIGGGSGGIGAALAAAREGLRVVLVERDGLLGGTSTLGGVHCWEMGAGGTGIPFDLYRRMRRIPRGAGVYSFARHCCWPEGGAFPGGEQRIDPARRYLDTLRRHGAQSLSADEAFVREHWHGIPFEPVALHTAARELLAATGCCNVLLGKELVSVEAEPGGARIRAVRLHDGSRLRARAWVDATGDATLCRMAGCELVSGQEPRSRYHEPAAPEAPTDTCNAATLIYRIRPADRDAVEPLPADIPADCWWADRFPVMSCTEYPNGDRNCNMLPTLEGEACRRLGPDAARREGIRRVRAHWHALQTAWPEFRRFRLAWIAPR